MLMTQKEFDALSQTILKTVEPRLKELEAKIEELAKAKATPASKRKQTEEA